MHEKQRSTLGDHPTNLIGGVRLNSLHQQDSRQNRQLIGRLSPDRGGQAQLRETLVTRASAAPARSNHSSVSIPSIHRSLVHFWTLFAALVVLPGVAAASSGDESRAARRDVEAQIAAALDRKRVSSVDTPSVEPAAATLDRSDPTLPAARVALEFWKSDLRSLDRLLLFARAWSEVEIRYPGTDEAIVELRRSLGDASHDDTEESTLSIQVAMAHAIARPPVLARAQLGELHGAVDDISLEKALAWVSLEAERPSAALLALENSGEDTECKVLRAWARDLESRGSQMQALRSLASQSPDSLLAQQASARVSLRASRPVGAKQALDRARYLSPRNPLVEALQADWIQQTDSAAAALAYLVRRDALRDSTHPAAPSSEWRARNATHAELLLKSGDGSDARAWIKERSDSDLSPGWQYWIRSKSLWIDREVLGEAGTEELRSVVDSWERDAADDLPARQLLASGWLAFLNHDLPRLEGLAARLPAHAPERVDRWVEQLRQRTERKRGSERFHGALWLGLVALLAVAWLWWKTSKKNGESAQA